METDIMTLLNGSIEYQKKSSGLEKAQRILDLIKMANIRYQTYTNDAKLDINKWLGRSEKLIKRAELFKAMEVRLQNYFKKSLIEMMPEDSETKVLEAKLSTKEATLKIMSGFVFEYLDLFETKFNVNQDFFNYEQLANYLVTANYIESRFQRKGIQDRVVERMSRITF